jgi:AcrR family transcriptional regulator
VGLREEKKLEQHRAILDTTVTFFRERGFEETRVRDVTGRLRISEGTFFNHFASKQAVLDAAALDLLERVTGLLHRDAAEDTRPAAIRLEEVVVAFATGFAGDREFATLLARHTQFFLGRWSDTQWQEQAYRPLTRLLDDGQRRGEVRGDIPASQLAEPFVGINLVTISN